MTSFLSLSDENFGTSLENAIRESEDKERKIIQSLCDLFGKEDLNSMREVEDLYTNYISDPGDTAIVNRTFKSMKSESDSEHECARRLLYRQDIRRGRDKIHHEACMARQLENQEAVKAPIKTRLAILLGRAYYLSPEYGPRIAKDFYIATGFVMALRVLICTPPEHLPKGVNDILDEAFPSGYKEVDEEALIDFEAKPERLRALIRAVEYWRKPGFWEDRT